MAVANKSTWTSVDVGIASDLEALLANESAEAIERTRKAVSMLQCQGILDADDRRVRKDLPADMREDSNCDMSSLRIAHHPSVSIG